jgi:4-diphosphocytidyl-2-C-methyl-D-erythritol kinase
MKVVVRAPAKINLQLSVGPLGDDGFHELATVFQAISIYDEISIESAAKGNGIDLSFTGDGAAGLPVDDKNLAYQATKLFAKHTKIDCDIKISINKGIPIAGGMAGGSADAAGTLVALDALFETSLKKDELLKLAAKLGSDVPFSLMGGTAIGSGRGDQLTPALCRGTFHWVLAFSSQGLSTPAVYAESDRLRQSLDIRKPRVSEELMHALSGGDAIGLGKALVNDLQPAAISLRPALKMAIGAGIECKAIGAIVSGSGPTVAFLASDEESAIDLAVALASTGAVTKINRASSPVHGPKLI